MGSGLSKVNRSVVFARPVVDHVDASNLDVQIREFPTAGAGQVLVRNHYLSINPLVRALIDKANAYSNPLKLGSVIPGHGAGQVLVSNHPEFVAGDYVTGVLGWQEYCAINATDLKKVDITNIPLSAHLSVLGAAGLTAWCGVNLICMPKKGETFLVSSAAGAIGSLAGQLAAQAGCRVIGIAGGPEKCTYVTTKLGFDACVDYRQAQNPAILAEMIRAHAPEGIHSYFDNVGGSILDAAILAMQRHGRIAMCGMISSYDGTHVPLHNMLTALLLRLSICGFRYSEHQDLFPRAFEELERFYKNGSLIAPESIHDGIEQTPQVFVDLFSGHGLGLRLVRLPDSS
jgi:NADPH-dependent curcumin reductase CurA